MGKIFSDISVSLDGFIAGPNPTLKEPLGTRGEELHEWVVRLASWRALHGMSGGETGPDNEIMKKASTNVGAVIMGRKMFSGGSGPWDADPNPDGWWGDNPPFHAPVFILTSHNRERVEKNGGTSYIFVTDGIESALSEARKAAGNKNISVAGGARVIAQFMQKGLLNELHMHLVPILLGGGTRLLEHVDTPALEKIRVLDSPYVTHLTFRLKTR